MKAYSSINRKISGFTLIELMIVVAVIGILAGIAIPTYRSITSKADTVAIVEDVRNLQSAAVIFMEDHGRPPTTDELDQIYHRSGKDSIVGEYAIVSPYTEGGDSGGPTTMVNVFPEGVDGYTPQNWVICSLSKINNAAYVYGLDDNPPEVAGKGENPLAPLCCGPGDGANGGGDDDDDDEEPQADDDDDAQGDDDVQGDDDDAQGDDDVQGDDDDDNDDDDDDDDDEEEDTEPCNDEPMNKCPLVCMLCPCDGGWANHGAYESCVAHASNECKKQDLISGAEKAVIQSAAAQSDCGK